MRRFALTAAAVAVVTAASPRCATAQDSGEPAAAVEVVAGQPAATTLTPITDEAVLEAAHLAVISGDIAFQDGTPQDTGRPDQVIVVRYRGQAYAFNLACPHENTALKWLPKDGRFQCPKHESQYQPTGVFTTGRATRNMDRLGIRLEDNMLVVDLNKFYKSDKNPEGWTSATVAL